MDSTFGGAIDELRITGKALSPDNLLLGTLIFADGFESGDASAWSSEAQ